MISNYNPDYPILVGLAGKAATGKTSVAEAIVPKASFGNERDEMIWDHLFFAMPLYELFSIRTKIEGENKDSRQLYAIHETLYDIYGSSPLGKVPKYADLIELVYAIYEESIYFEGSKPRTFLQKVGDYCRHYDPNCFASWGIRKAKKIYRENILSTENEVPHCILISDVRFKNEAEAILAEPNSFLIRFDADPEIRRERIFNRDNVYMTDDQMSHSSEKELDQIEDSLFHIIDSSNMTIEQQVDHTVSAIKRKFLSHAKN
jgi:hypothetical protein